MLRKAVCYRSACRRCSYRMMTTWPVSEPEKLSLHMMEVAVGIEVLIAKMSDTLKGVLAEY
jgi:hypothetical protein